MAMPYEHAVEPRATKITTVRLKAFGMSFPMVVTDISESVCILEMRVLGCRVAATSQKS